MIFSSNIIFWLSTSQVNFNGLLGETRIDVITAAMIWMVLALIVFMVRAPINRPWNGDLSNLVLEQSEEIFRLIFNNISVGIALVDPKGYIITANEADCRFLGYTQTELIGMHFTKFTYAEDLEVDTSLYNELLNGERESYIIDKRYVRKNGELVWGRLSVGLIRDATGQPKYTTVVCTDISDAYRDAALRQQAEAALRESQQQLAAIAANLPGVVYRYILHPDGKFSIPYVSEGMQELLGISAQEIMACPERVFERVEPEDRIRLDEAIRSSAQTLAPLNSEYRLHALSGEVKWVRAIAKLHARQNHDIVFDGLALDITPYKYAEEALRESEATNRALISGIPDALYRIHRDGTYVDYVPSLEVEPYLSPSQFLGKKVQEVMPEPIASQLHHAKEQALATGKTQVLEYQLLLHNQLVDYDVRILAITKNEVLAMVRDISSRKQAERALQEQKQRTELILQTALDGFCTISLDGYFLDINPAFCAIVGYSPAELLGMHISNLDTIETPEEIAKHVNIIVQNGFDYFETKLRRKDGSLVEVEASANCAEISGNRFIFTFVRDITHRKEAAAALQESQHFIQKIANTTPVILYVYDFLENRDIYINSQVMEILGYTPEQFQAMKSSLNESILHPDDLVRLLAIHNRWHQVKDGEIIRTEFRMRHADGSWRILEAHETLFTRTPEGLPKQILGAAVDITERRQAEEERDRFFNLSLDLLGIAGFDGYFRRVNPAVTTILGYSAEEFMSTPFIDLVHPDDRNLTLAEYQKVMAGQRTLYFENRYRCKDSSYKWLSWTAVPVLSTGLIYVVARDTTERRQAEEALRESREKYKVLFEILPIGISITDEVGNIIDVNPASEKILGISKEEHTQRNYGGEEWKLVNSEGNPLPPERYTSVRALQENRLIENVELGVVQSDNQITWLNVTAAPIPLKGYGVTIAYIDITERKLAQEALHQREKEFRTLAENTPDIIARFDKQLRHVYVNPAAELVSGFSPQQLMGKTHREIGLPETQVSLWEKKMRQVFETGCETILEIDTVTPNGGKYFQCKIVPELAVEGTVEFILCTTRDITELKHLEASLRMAQARLQYLLDVSPAIIYSCKASEAGGCTFMSENVSSILGYAPRNFVENPHFWVERVHPEDVELVFADLPKLFEDGRHIYEYRFQHQDGSYRWMYDELHLVKDAAGNLLEKVGCWIDITQRKQAEEQLIRVSQAVESASDGIAIADIAEQHIYHNRALQELFEYTTEELAAAGGPPALFVDPALGCEVFDTIRQGGMWSGEVQMRTRSGKILEILLRANAIKDNTGKMLGLVAVHTDISKQQAALRERKRIQEELAQQAAELARSNAELEQFAYVASHDLQEPLRMVASYTQLLARRYAGQLDEKADRFIAHAVDGANRMQQLIEDLLKYSRVGTRGKELIPVNCQVVFATAVSNLQLTIRESGAVVAGQNLPVVMGDETQLVQLFQNLIGNAIKYRGERSPTIRVQAQRQQSNWLFSVSDNGIGIEPQHTERIFQIFQRLHLREEYPGTGIGLALCKKIVERHGGQIWVESQLGQGATFYFTLPDSGGILL